MFRIFLAKVNVNFEVGCIKAFAYQPRSGFPTHTNRIYSPRRTVVTDNVEQEKLRLRGLGSGPVPASVWFYGRFAFETLLRAVTEMHPLGPVLAAPPLPPPLLPFAVQPRLPLRFVLRRVSSTGLPCWSLLVPSGCPLEKPVQVHSVVRQGCWVQSYTQKGGGPHLG